MKNIFVLVAALFLFLGSSAQELNLLPLKNKDYPVEAVNYLKNQKLKAKKAKWFYAEPGIYMADFIKKKESKAAFYFLSNGVFLYKRTPVKQADFPKGLVDALGNRMSAPGTKVYVFKGNNYFTVYAVTIPTSETTYVSEYFTTEGKPYDMKFK